jgi:hypothetical protein
MDAFFMVNQAKDIGIKYFRDVILVVLRDIKGAKRLSKIVNGHHGVCDY